MIALTSTAHGPASGLRQGRSRAWDAYQCRIAAARPSTMTTPIVAQPAAAEPGTITLRALPASLRLRLVTILHTHGMDHNPSGGAGGSGRQPVAASPDQRPDQDLLPVPGEPLPLSGSTGVTLTPAIPGRPTALDLDAVSDYVPDLDDGQALDYGPVPDNDAARDYHKAIHYDALPGHRGAPHRDAPPRPDPGPDPRRSPGSRPPTAPVPA